MTTSNLSSSSSSGTIDSQSLVPAIEDLTVSPPTETSTSCSVIEKVISDTDLLTLILICLPVKSIFLFKSVSKQWFSIISDPIFAITHSRRPDRKITGLFLERNAPTPMDYIYESYYHFLLLDGSNKCEQRYQGEQDEVTNTTLIGGGGGGYIKIPRIFGNDPEPGMYGSVREFCVRVTQSCNGILCCIKKSEFAHAHYLDRPCTYKIYIYNPTTRQYRCLPPSPFRDDAPKRDDCCIKVCNISLAFDPMKSMEYQVICIWRYQPNLSIHPDYWDEDILTKYYLEIYSSKTNTWRKLANSFYGHVKSFSRSGVYWDGCLHWVASGQFLNAESSMYFDVEQELVKPLPASPNADESKVMYFGECGGHLYLVELLKSCYTHYNILKMEIDYSGWKLIHKLDLESLIALYPGRDVRFHDLKFLWRTVVFLEEDEAESLSKLVMVVGGQEVISYDFKQTSVTQLHTFPGLFFFLDAPIGGVWGHLYNYIESLACV